MPRIFQRYFVEFFRLARSVTGANASDQKTAATQTSSNLYKIWGSSWYLDMVFCQEAGNANDPLLGVNIVDMACFHSTPSNSGAV